MKQWIALLLIVTALAAPVMAIDKWSRNVVHMFGLGSFTSATTFALDSAFTYETSGDAGIYIFNSPVTQTNAALTFYVYCTAATGTPSSSSMDIYASATSGDPQRPQAGASPLASSGNVSATGCSTASWLTYTIASVSLSAGSNYFLIIRNDTATPASNNFTIQTRSVSVRLASNGNTFGDSLRSCTTTDGMTTDPTCQSTAGGPHGVLAFGDGTVWGNPFVATASTTTSTNYRGNRYNFDEQMIVSGIAVAATATTTITVTVEVYNGASQLSTVTKDLYSKSNTLSGFFSAPVTFPKATDIDIVIKPASNSTAGTYMTIGNSPPADVQTAAGPVTYVNGATPGSFTETADQYIPMGLIIDNNPAIAGGGGGCIIGGR